MNFFHAPGIMTYSSFVTAGGSSSGIISRPDQTNPGAGFVATRFTPPVWTGTTFKTLSYVYPAALPTYKLTSSPTGATWTYSDIPTGYTMLLAGSDAAGNTMLVLTASGAAIVSQLSYDDGVTWTAGPTGLTVTNNVAYLGYADVNNTWYSYSAAVPSVVKLSTDNFATMTTTTTNRTMTGASIPVFNSAGIGLTIQTLGTGAYERTTDFINWTSSTALNVLPTGTRYVQSAGPSFFAYVSTTAAGGCYFSTDGVTWTVTNLPTQISSGTNKIYFPAEFAYVNGAYVCVFNNWDNSTGGQLLSGRYYRSADGITWTLSNTLANMYSWTSKCESPTRVFMGSAGMGYLAANYAILT